MGLLHAENPNALYARQIEPATFLLVNLWLKSMVRRHTFNLLILNVWIKGPLNFLLASYVTWSNHLFLKHSDGNTDHRKMVPRHVVSVYYPLVPSCGYNPRPGRLLVYKSHLHGGAAGIWWNGSGIHHWQRPPWHLFFPWCLHSDSTQEPQQDSEPLMPWDPRTYLTLHRRCNEISGLYWFVKACVVSVNALTSPQSTL